MEKRIRTQAADANNHRNYRLASKISTLPWKVMRLSSLCLFFSFRLDSVEETLIAVIQRWIDVPVFFTYIT